MIKLSIPLFLLILLSFEYANAQPAKNQFVLNGKINGIENGIIYLSHYDEDLQTGKTDSSQIKDGLFSFSGKVYGPTLAFIKLSKKEALGVNAIDIILEPANMQIELMVNEFVNNHMTGSKMQADYQELWLKSKLIRKNHPELFDSSGYTHKNLSDSLSEKLDKAFDTINRIDYDYFSAHPKSYLSAYLLRYHARKLSLDSLAMFFSRLDDVYKKSIITETVRSQLKNMKVGTVGTVAPKFFAKDTSGNEFYSGFIKEKYILLDFWATWCVPCRQNSPQLIELHKKYKDKGLRIVGIADDRDLNKWKDAIKKDSTFLWTQILRGANHALKIKGLKDDGDINDKFDIQTLPTYIIIDPYGVIIGRYSEDIAELNKQLAAIFK